MHFWNFQESARSVLSVLSAETLSAYMRSGESGDVYFVFALFHGTHIIFCMWTARPGAFCKSVSVGLKTEQFGDYNRFCP